MDTVSYLTINDETKEIADIASRNDIENMAAIIAAHSNDIEYIQLETSPQGSFSTSISETQAMAQAAQVNALASSEAAAIADSKATAATQAAERAWTYADTASEAASLAQNKADQATLAASIADEKAASATNAANVAWNQANSATNAASEAWNKADEATDAANLANHKADLANAAALSAQADARRANNYADGALAGLSTLESVVDTVNWFAEHKSLSTDIEVDPNKNYYTYDSSTGTMSKIEPDGSENPSEEGWYEIDETVQNYVSSHLAQTDDGLYVLSMASGWRILVSTGSGNYVPGIFIVNPYGVIEQSMTNNGISFDEGSPFSIGDDNAYIVFDGNGHITLGGSGINILSSVTVGGSNKTLSQVLNDLGQAITTIEYGVGNSSNSHADINEWSTDSPQWQPDKYIWMRTSNGTNYTYTCIQGVQGPKGETGEQGQQGERGMAGTGIDSVEISYGISESENTIPETWKASINLLSPEIIEEEDSDEDIEEEEEEGEVNDESLSIPSLPQGIWLWTRTVTTYTDDTSDISYQKSYIGTDGQDGNSIFIQSTSKENGITTITLVDGGGNTETIEIADGQDGEQGTQGPPGADGLTSYTHFAWATSVTTNTTVNPPTISVSGFSKSDSLNKSYIGIYSDTVSIDSDNPLDYTWTLIKGEQGEDGKILNILPGVYTISQLPSINNVEDGDAYLVDDGDGQYDLYYKGDGASNWTIVENWGGMQGPKGDPGQDGATGPEAVVTITPININWTTGVATLSATLRVNGTIVTPTSYKWTKGIDSRELTANSDHTLTVDDLNSTYNCTVTWG